MLPRPCSAPIPWNFGSSCIGRIIRARNAGGRLNSRRQLLHRCAGDTLNKLPKSQPPKTVFANRQLQALPCNETALLPGCRAGGAELHQAGSIRVRPARLVVPDPPVVRRGLGIALRRVLPLLLTPE